jgi:hypothetical protein
MKTQFIVQDIHEEEVTEDAQSYDLAVDFLTASILSASAAKKSVTVSRRLLKPIKPTRLHTKSGRR